MESIVTNIAMKITEKKGFKGSHTKINWIRSSIEILIIVRCVILLILIRRFHLVSFPCTMLQPINNSNLAKSHVRIYIRKIDKNLVFNSSICLFCLSTEKMWTSGVSGQSKCEKRKE